ncbi:MAG: polysaccharide deacetylase family protein [Candidatus Bathyarchaeia archaeon]
MTDICLIFEAHQPFRLKRDFDIRAASYQKIGSKDLYEAYFDHKLNKEIFTRVSERCYFPATKIILEQIERFRIEKKPFKVSFSFSGTFLEQCERWNSDLLDLFKQVIKTGCVELLSQTYYHSLASLNTRDDSEVIEQVDMHKQALKDLFNYVPETFENTECIYNNNIAKVAESLGFRTVLTEGVDRILGWRSPNYLYKAKGSSVNLLLRNYRLSDDIGFRFASTWWDQWPLTADKYAAWLAHTPGQVIVIFLDYETFGEHYWAESGILEFLKWLPIKVSRWDNLCWSTPREVVQKYAPCDEIDVPPENTISWADVERDLSAWLGNPQQIISLDILHEIGLLIKEANEPNLLRVWRYLQTSDHFHYMCTKGGGSGIVHGLFNPHGHPLEAFKAYMKVLLDLGARCLMEMSKTESMYRRLLRHIPRSKCFRFFNAVGAPTDILATSLEELCKAIRVVSLESIIFHLSRGDFERWIFEVIGDESLAAKIANLCRKWSEEERVREALISILEERLKEIKSLIVSKGEDKH